MNKKIEYYFTKLTNTIDDVTSSVLNSSRKDNSEYMKKVLNEIFNEFIKPVIEVHNELEGAEIARKYILELGGINTTILTEKENEILKDWIEEKYEGSVEDEEEYFDEYESDSKIVC